ncbi:hypothetical protein BSP109_02182 [Brevibacterium sp. Mu109]|uniref:hypothetical protein n=1 Tax=Brevibacterium sp. Mu109 TaxID=1255669 RepID=UPI000C3F254E|nr:hypothetical protein [Brevibacterium sp. Mu109]MDN5896871.1 hypothetical protein [Nocardioides sp.]SMX87160.1 hypothetical protein BSP109_02182 [Brevibacterium sp. Mu109]
MTTYSVAWLIDIDADTPTAAARRALAIHRNPESIAVVFEVTDPDRTHHIDLLDEHDG